MKRLHIVLGVVALMAVAVSVTAATNLSAAAPNQLVVDGVVTFIIDPSSAIGKGEQGYFEGDVFEEGQFGVSPPIGEFKGSFVSTEGIGPGASIGKTVWRISDEGDIWVARVFDDSLTPEFEGAIIGGTGRFAGASGEYSATIVSFDPFVFRATFTFKADLLFLPVISNN